MAGGPIATVSERAVKTWPWSGPRTTETRTERMGNDGMSCLVVLSPSATARLHQDCPSAANLSPLGAADRPPRMVYPAPWPSPMSTTVSGAAPAARPQREHHRRGHRLRRGRADRRHLGQERPGQEVGRARRRRHPSPAGSTPRAAASRCAVGWGARYLARCTPTARAHAGASSGAASCASATGRTIWPLLREARPEPLDGLFEALMNLDRRRNQPSCALGPTGVEDAAPLLARLARLMLGAREIQHLPMLSWASSSTSVSTV